MGVVVGVVFARHRHQLFPARWWAPFLGNTEAINTWLWLRLAPRLRFDQIIFRNVGHAAEGVGQRNADGVGTHLLQWKANLR